MTALQRKNSSKSESPSLVKKEQPKASPLIEKTHSADKVTYERESPYEDPIWPIHLFFNEKFSVHRILGLLYLVQYVAAWRLYVTDYSAFASSSLLWTLPLNGLAQSLTATYYFSFLPKKDDPGYYSDKSALSYDFVKENIFYASVLLWQWLYYADAFYGPLTSVPALTVCEHLLTFLPYFFRTLVGKTSFRKSLENDKNKSEGNAIFFYWATVITKAFYVWAKWYIGFYFNYLRYLNLVNKDQVREMYMLLLFSAFATTISMFLHTLKFKGYMGPKTAFLVYMASYMATFISIVRLYELFLGHLPLVGITFVAMMLNRFGHLICGSEYRDVPCHLWQLFTMGLLYSVRSGLYTPPFPL
jgi:hypothetical protein